MSHNSITGDKIATKPSKAYAEGYDAIFRKAGLCAPFPAMDKQWPQEKIDELRNVLTRINEPESCPMCDVVVEAKGD